MKRRYCAAALVLAAFGTSPAIAQNGGTSVHPVPPREARAASIAGPIVLDGRLDEPIWQQAPAATDFIQSQPNEGQPATQRTEVRFLFDDAALYIGARMYDDLGTDGVRSRLVRRDGSADSDELSITFDTFHDHLGRTNFTINPAGVRGDAFGPGGASTDRSWDPVWEAKTAIDSLGWTAEIRIPFSQLRFTPRNEPQTWGLQIVRLVNRLNERSHWAFWRLNESGGPNRYGHLTGLDIRNAPGKAELLPYVVGRSTNLADVDPADPFRDSHTMDARVGADLKYFVTSNLTLSATVNPDFGQVEVDPAVVNLSAFETFFPERRPFFIEGAGLLRFGGLNCFFCSNVSSLSLFFSRRIGRPPQGAGNALARGPYADVPENTTILGAAKLTGRTGSGWSVGLLDAVTRREHARVLLPDSSTTSVTVEPFTNYFVGRLARDLRGGDLQVGGMVTSVVRDLDEPFLANRLNRHAEAAGLEANWWFGSRDYRLMTSWAVSQIAGEPEAVLRAQTSSARYFQRPDRQHGGNGLFTDRFDPDLTTMRGFAGYARFSKESGDWLFETATNFRSPGFEVNDLAFLTRADYVWMNGNVLRQFTRPGSWYRQLVFIAGGQQQFNFDGDVTDRQTQTFAYIQPHNYWDVNVFWIHRFTTDDDRLTRGGPVLRRPGINFWQVFASTDSRNPVVLGLSPGYGCNFEGACDWSVDLDVTWRPAPNVSVTLGPGFSHSESEAQFVTAVDDPTAAAFFGRRYVFADLEQKTLSMNTRLNITFTPTLSLELFMQPFISGAAFNRFKEFAAPRTLAKRVYGEDVGTIALADSTYTVDPDGTGPAETFTFARPDFTLRSLRGNAVLRWEYLPGSTLFLVWTQSRGAVGPDGDLAFSRDVDALFAADADNVFLVKLNYWIGL